MERRSILQHRLNNQLLSYSKFNSAEETVQWMGAVQGQDYSPGLWAIGLRTPNATKEAIEKSLMDKKIVRSWTMRHTIHFVAIEDLQWMIHLSKDKMLKRYKNHMKKEAGLEEITLQQSLDVFSRALEGEKMLSRPALREVLEAARIDTSKQRLYHLLWHAAQNGLIFIGPMEGKQQTFGLTADWAPKAELLSREEAIHKLSIRYLQSHGPASTKDFAWWSGLTQKEAALGFQLAKSELFATDESLVEYWSLPNDELENLSSHKIHLVYGLDEFLIGYKDRSAALTEEVQSKLDPKKDGVFFPLLYEGKVIGSWKPTIKKTSLSMQYTLATSLEVPEALLMSEAERYSFFFNLTLLDVSIERI